MRTLPVDIEGLDLVLGGGFALLKRVEGAGESATILIRGAAGSGKTVLGTQFAASIARALGSHVAYGCVELLPSELRAQYDSVRPESKKDKVVLLGEASGPDPDPDPEPDSKQVLIYAGLLDLGEDGSVERFGDAVEALLEDANARARQKVRVLVIDSLSEGYRLGASAPRTLADGVCKFAAERGLIVILLEEQSHDGASNWSFAVDTVFELKPADEGTPFERRLVISKSRLGPSDPGPHEFMVRSRAGVMIMPRVKAYQRQWRREILQKRALPSEASQTISHPWFADGSLQRDWLPNFRTTTTAVVGEDSTAVRRVALWLGSQVPDSASGSSFVGDDIRFVVGKTNSPIATRTPEEKQEWVYLTWGPLQNGPATLFALMRAIGSQARKERAPKRVVIGDLAAARYHSDPAGIAGTISVLASFLRDLKIPLILYETGEAGNSSSLATVTADVICTCLETPPQVIKTGEERRFRLSTDWNGELFTVQI